MAESRSDLDRLIGLVPTGRWLAGGCRHGKPGWRSGLARPGAADEEVEVAAEAPQEEEGHRHHEDDAPEEPLNEVPAPFLRGQGRLATGASLGWPGCGEEEHDHRDGRNHERSVGNAL